VMTSERMPYVGSTTHFPVNPTFSMYLVVGIAYLHIGVRGLQLLYKFNWVS
jgi:hypothetical protein